MSSSWLLIFDIMKRKSQNFDELRAVIFQQLVVLIIFLLFLIALFQVNSWMLIIAFAMLMGMIYQFRTLGMFYYEKSHQSYECSPCAARTPYKSLRNRNLMLMV